jgi:hypothetical protein
MSALCGPGSYTHLVMAGCPWCCLGDDKTVHAFREVFGGYCGPDFVCGRCGQSWSGDDKRLRHPSEDKREENVALVQRMSDEGVLITKCPLPALTEDGLPGNSSAISKAEEP